LSASSTSTDGYYITGSISVNVSLDSGTFDYSFTGESGANFINHSYADGTSTLDVYFTLTTPAVVELSELIGTPPDGPTYSYGSATLLDSGNNVLASIAGGFAGYPEPTPVFASLSTGTYQFQAELNTTPSAGTGGLAGGDIDLSIAPEPTTFLLLAPFLLMTRRPRTNRGFKPWPILRAASRGQPFPSSAHKDYSPPSPPSP
jgi:hypothetical protein